MLKKTYKDSVKIYLKENGLLYFSKDNKEIQIHVKKCFPWSHPKEFLSLRDNDDNEVFMVERLEDVDAKIQTILHNYMDLVDFILEIIKIHEIKEDIELRQYFVSTKQGRRTFQTKLEDWPEVMEDGSVLIEDLAGDLFKVRSYESLDEKSKKILSTYVA